MEFVDVVMKRRAVRRLRRAALIATSSNGSPASPNARRPPASARGSG